MNFRSSAELKDEARELLIGKYGSFFVIIMIVMAANLLLAAPARYIGSYLISFLFTMLASVLLGVFKPGLCLFFLNIACDRKPLTSDIYYAFNKSNLKKSLLLSVYVVFPEMILMIPYGILGYMADRASSVPLMLAAYGTLAIGELIYLPYSLFASQAFYLMLDFPSLDAFELVALSFKRMRGHAARLLLLRLSFIPMYLLGICSMGLGFVWILAYVNMANALFFMDLMKNPA